MRRRCVFSRRSVKSTVAFMVVSVILIGSPVKSLATRTGISVFAGSGLFVATDEDYYGDIKVDLYPEIGLHLDMYIVRLGLRAGLIYRKYELAVWYWDYYSDGYYDYLDYTHAFIPVQVELIVAPLATSEDYMFSPYVGLLAGAYLPVGDNEDTLPAFSPLVGGEFFIEPFVLYGDLRYTFAKDDDYQAGGFMFVIGGGLRFGSVK